MNPLKLKIKGINSFMEEQIIDFKKLTERGIFGIVGDTGSGKSTIIDCIIIALYGKIPRFGDLKKDFINSNLEDGFISFEFKINIGADSKIFLIERGFHRNKKGNVEEVISRFLDITDGEKSNSIGEKKRDIGIKVKEIIGLEYDDFVRAVILPQGKFSQFLTLGGKTRSLMLERIFKLEKYGEELSKKVRDANTLKRQSLQLVESKLTTYEGITLEKIQLLKDENEKLEKNIIELTSSQKENIKKLENEKANLNLFKSLAEVEVNLLKLIPLKEKYKNYEKNLIESEKIEGLMDHVNKINSQTKILSNLIESETTINIKVNKCKERQGELSNLFFQIEQKKENEYEVLGEKISKALRATELKKELVKKENELAKMGIDYRLLESKIKSEKESQKKLDLENNELKDKLSILNKQKIDNTVTQKYRNITNIGAETEKKLNEINKELLKKSNELNETEKNQINNNKEITIANEELLKLKEIEDANIFLTLNKIKENLSCGDQCPVCGEIIKKSIEKSKEDNNHHNYSNIEETNKKIFDLKLKIENKKESLKINLEQIKKILDEKIELEETEKNLNLKLKELKENSGCNFFADEIIKIKNKGTEYENIEMQIVSLTSKQNLKNIEYEQKNIIIVEFEKEGATLIQIGRTLKERIVEIKDEIYKLIENENSEELVKTLENQRAEILKNYNDLKISLKDINEELQKNIENQNKISTELNLIKNNIEIEKTILDEKMEVLGFKEVSDFNKNFIEKEKREDLKEEVENFNNKLFVEENKKSLLLIQTEKLNYNETEKNYNELIEKIQNIEIEIKEKTLESGSKNGLISQMEDKLPIIEKLLEEKIKTEKNLDNLKILNDMFKGNRFVDFISARHLYYITKEASERLFKISGGKYSMELDKIEFVIKDNGRGGILRSTKTLSGGEVFMVSLCLSLALSSKIQLKNNGSLDMFFLDEGFGTLDSSSLEIVMDNLFSLVDDKMKIGLITHVEELKGNLPRKLLVTSGNLEKGSTVEII